MLRFGLTQRHKKPSSRERGTARVRVLSGSLRDRKLRSGKKVNLVQWHLLQEVWLHLAARCAQQAFLVEVHEHSFCTALWSKSVGGIEDCPECLSRVPQGRRQATSTQIELRQAPRLQQEKQALTRQQQRHRCVIGFFVQQSGLEADDMSHRAILGFVSCAPSCSSDAFADHVVLRRILQDLACGGGEALSQREKSRQMSLAMVTLAPGNSTV